MMTEDELKAIMDYYEQYSMNEAHSDIQKLVTEVRRLNTAYAVCKLMFDPDNQASPFRGVMV